MDRLPTIISCLAFLVSIFTFWWSNLREKRNLYLVQLHRIERFEAIDFALVNAGSKDLLITDIYVCFDSPPNESRFYPSVKIDTGSAISGLISAGKAIEHRIEFLEPFTSSFAAMGKKADPWPNLFTHIAHIEIHWVDMKGKTYTASIPHTRVGLNQDGTISGISPFSKNPIRHELYSSAT